MTRHSHKEGLITMIEDNYWDFASEELRRFSIKQLEWILSYLEDKEGPDSQPGPILSEAEKKALKRRAREYDFPCFDPDEE